VNRYRVKINLIKEYEVYVDADTAIEARTKGYRQLESGEGDLVDDYFDDESLDVTQLHQYKCTQKVVRTYRHYCEAADEDEARKYADREFSLKNCDDWEEQEIGDIEVEEDTDDEIC